MLLASNSRQVFLTHSLPTTAFRAQFRLERRVVRPNACSLSVIVPVHTITHSVVRQVSHKLLFLELPAIWILYEPKLWFEVLDDF